MKDDRVYLNHVLQCIQKIEKHRRLGRKRFFASETIQDALILAKDEKISTARQIAASKSFWTSVC